MQSAQSRQLIDKLIAATAKNPVPQAGISNDGLQPGQWRPGSALESVCQKMNYYEAAKYQPAGVYGYQKLVVDDKRVSYTSYNGTALTKDQLEQSYENALALRKLSLIAGVIYMLEETATYLTKDPSKRQSITKVLWAMAQKVRENQQGQPYEDVNVFLDNLTNTIMTCLSDDAVKQDDVIRNIRNAERYFVAEYKQSHITINKTKMGNDEYLQIDIPALNQLSKELKEEFVRIHDSFAGRRPSWFNIDALSEWEREWLLQKTPKNVNDDWSEFEGLFQASSMQHIPGIKNARLAYFLKKTGDNYQIVSKSYKTATLVPYEMPDQDMQRMTDMHAKHVVEQLSASRPTLIYVNSLLSDVMIGGGMDNDLVKRQVEAVKQMSETLPCPVIAGNDPVNFLRMMTPATGALAESLGRWAHVDAILAYYKNQYKGNNPIAAAAAAQLAELRQTGFSALKSRNLMAHKSAYISLLVEAMGGVVTTNCKSGKDRTGLDEIYRNAMMIYFDKYNKLPGYHDDWRDRQRFIDIFVQLFNTRKAQESAAANTPGSFGLKDEARMLCRDIVGHLRENYATSNRAANLNKPPRILGDETHAMIEKREHENQIKKKIKKAHRLMPYMSGLLIEMASKVYTSQVSDYTASITGLSKRIDSLVDEWMRVAPDELKKELMEYKNTNDQLVTDMNAALDASARTGQSKKIIYFSDDSTPITAQAGKTVSEMVKDELAQLLNQNQTPHFNISSAKAKSPQMFAVTEVAGDEYARKNINTFSGRNYTTIQHQKANGSCTSHLMFNGDALSKLSNKEMVALAIRNVEDFQAVSKGGSMRFSGNMNNVSEARFVKIMIQYSKMMGYKYTQIPKLEQEWTNQADFVRTLEIMKKSPEHAHSLFKYKQKTAKETDKPEDNIPMIRPNTGSKSDGG